MGKKKKDKGSGPSSIREAIASNVSEIIQLEHAQRMKSGVAERMASAIGRFCGSMTFVYLHIVWFGLWIVSNDFPNLSFDPFPYTLLNLLVLLELIFLSTFILISQNHEGQLTERRDHLNLQINLLAEQENTKILELLQRIADEIGVAYDPELEVLLAPIHPKKLVKHIVKASAEEA